LIRSLTSHKVSLKNWYLTVDQLFPTIPPQPLALLSTLTGFFISIPGLNSEYEQIYTDVRGAYLSNSLSDLSADVLSAAQGRSNQTASSDALVRAFISLLEAEVTIVNSLISARQTDLLASAIANPMGQISRTFKALNTQIRSSPNSNLTLALGIMDDLGVCQESFERSAIPKDIVDGMRKELIGLEKEAKGIGAAGVGDVLDEIKRRGQFLTTLPPDGSVIDLTIDVLILLSLLTIDYDETFGFSSIFKASYAIAVSITFRQLE
jgi:Exo70 exocyst complex subunit